jgi:cyclopropane fatty-acyl-phospholipid synthase-like methyltransferase
MRVDTEATRRLPTAVASGSSDPDEPALVRERYARRGSQSHYSLLNRSALLMMQERQRAITDVFVRLGWADLANVRLLEIGCGWGGNLLEFLRLGFSPEHLQGIELLSDRAEAARRVLPQALRISIGDAAAIESPVSLASQDVVYHATVFTSLLNDAFQQRLADRMWAWVRPGGGVLWYDFTVNNPRNPDVRGVSVPRIRELFPAGRMHVRRLTLAPPIARTVTRLHPAMYPVFNACPWLRTHVLAWIEKPR